MHDAYRMRDDGQVRCYAVLVDMLRSGTATAAQVPTRCAATGFAQRDFDDGCMTAADRLVSARA